MFGVVGIAARKAPEIILAIQMLQDLQNANGSWSAFAGDDPAGCWATALVMLVLLTVGGRWRLRRSSDWGSTPGFQSNHATRKLEPFRARRLVGDYRPPPRSSANKNLGAVRACPRHGAKRTARRTAAVLEQRRSARRHSGGNAPGSALQCRPSRRRGGPAAPRAVGTANPRPRPSAAVRCVALAAKSAGIEGAAMMAPHGGGANAVPAAAVDRRRGARKRVCELSPRPNAPRFGAVLWPRNAGDPAARNDGDGAAVAAVVRRRGVLPACAAPAGIGTAEADARRCTLWPTKR